MASEIFLYFMVVVMLSVYYAVPTRQRYDPYSTAEAFVRLLLLFQIMASEIFLYFMVVVMLSVYYAVPTRQRYDPYSTAEAFVRLLLLFQIMASEVFLYDGGGDVISILRCTYQTAL